MLIIFGGLPGTGKTTIAKQLAKTVEAVYLRVDTIEQSLWQDVLDRDYQPWDNIDLQLDTSELSIEESIQKIIQLVKFKR